MLPTALLGELLAANRTGAGLTIDQVSRASGLAADRIAAVEGGRHDLSDLELSMLLDRYPIPSPSRRFTRTVVEIDLDGGTLRLRQVRRPRSVPAADRNLLQYLALVHRHFEIERGTSIPLKAVDLGLLRAALALRRDQVKSCLDRMGRNRSGLVRNRSLLAAALATGLVVAAGAVVLIPSGSSEEPDSPSPDPRIDIGTPLVVERDPADIPAPGPIVRPGVGDGTVEPGGGGGEETGDASIEPGADPDDAGAAQVRRDPAAAVPPVEPNAVTDPPDEIERPTSVGPPPSPTMGETRSRAPPEPNP